MSNYDNGDDAQYELILKLWAQRSLIAAITAVVMIVAVAYLFLSTPTYETKAAVLPPQLLDIRSLNVSNIELGIQVKNYLPDDVYKLFIRELRSEGARRKFFDSTYLPSLSEDDRKKPRDRLWEDFNKEFKISQPDLRNNPDLWYVIARKKLEPQLLADWVNSYIAQVSAETKSVVWAGLNSELVVIADAAKNERSALLTKTRKDRLDRIAQLQEGLVIAEATGTTAPQTIGGTTSASGELKQFMDGSLMYMRGSRAIRAELSVLQKRDSDEPFAAGLRAIDAKLEYLNELKNSPNSLSVFTLDYSAVQPDVPVMPKKALTLVLGSIIGGGLGLLVAFLRVSFRVPKSRSTEKRP